MADVAPRILPLTGIDMRIEPGGWDYAESRRAEVDAYFAAQQHLNPALWNGRILILARHRMADGVLAGRYRESDFAALLWWLRHDCPGDGPPGSGVCNAFSMAALRSADGAFLLGRMAAWTANAGKIYFAAGTPDLGDLRPDGVVDLAGAVLRELVEETGLSEADVAIAPGWTGVFHGSRIALMRELVSPLSADELVVRIRSFIAAEARSELDDVVVARGVGDLSEAMPPFIRAYLQACWEADDER